MNLEKSNSRPPTTKTSTTTVEPEQRSTRKRPTITRRTTEAPKEAEEEDEESTTENRIIEAKNRFNLKEDERPERLRFELTAGGKINFGFSSVKSRENNSSKIDSTDASKVKVITGPLNKSPITETSGRILPKGIVEEIPIQTSPKSVTVKHFSEKLDLDKIPLKKSDIESFVPDAALRTESSVAALEDSKFFLRKSRLRPSVIGFKKRPVGNVAEELTTEQPDEDGDNDDETTTKAAARLRPSKGRFIGREKSQVETEIKSELSNEISSQRISNRNRISQRGHDRNRANDQSSGEILETSSPRGFRVRQKALEESEDVTPSKYLTRVRASDLKLTQVLDDNINSETQDVPEESTLRTGYKTFHRFASGEDLSTESPNEENEIDFTTQNIESSDEETTANSFFEVTSQSSPRKLTIRKRPAKKIDFHAPRQTITEITPNKNDFDDFETTSYFNPDDYEIDFESSSSSSVQPSINIRTKPSRPRFVTRKRIITTNEEVNQSLEGSIIERPSTTPRSTTKKRVLIIKTKDGVIRNEVDAHPTTEENPSTEQSVEDSPKIDDFDWRRRRVKVFRTRPTTERSLEESTFKSIVARTRVIKRPASTPIPASSSSTTVSSESDENTSSSRPLNRFGTRKRLVKVSKKLTTGSESEESEAAKNQDVETVSESSTTIAPPRKRVFKVLRQKTPRVIADKPLEEDSLVIKTDDQNQQIEQVENEEQVGIVSEDNLESTSEESSRPSLKYPTRPGGRISGVTIRKKPFTQGSRTSTIHPASTRFTKDGVIPTRPRIAVRRKQYRPNGGVTSESSVSASDELEVNEKKFALGERNKKIFTTKYRKFSTTSSPPNITPHSEINTDSETTEFDELLDSTDTPINNDGNVLQNNKPSFSLKSRFTTTTSPKPTTLHHVFAIDEIDESGKLRNMTEEHASDEVIKKLQKLIEINRIVEVYSKEEKRNFFKNKKLKSIKSGELTVERPPMLDKFGEVSRQVIIKLKKKQTTENPDDSRSPKSIMFAETVFGNAETSTISLQGLFEREKKELESQKESEEKLIGESLEKQESSRPPTPHFRPESNETNPIVISLANLDQVILSKVPPGGVESEHDEETTTEYSVDDETTPLFNDD